MRVVGTCGDVELRFFGGAPAWLFEKAWHFLVMECLDESFATSAQSGCVEADTIRYENTYPLWFSASWFYSSNSVEALKRRSRGIFSGVWTFLSGVHILYIELWVPETRCDEMSS